MKAQAFESPAALSQYHEDEAIAEAVRVQAMSGEARAAWLQAWGRLQRRIAIVFPEAVAPTARCYTSLEEKNRFDEARELERAVRLARQREAQS